MEEALDLARAKDAKERMAGVERLYQFWEASRKSLSPAEVASLVDCCMDLLKDNNFRVSQGALQALSSAVVISGEHFKLHLNALIPAIVERLGDRKQTVRDAARQLLITVMRARHPHLSSLLPSPLPPPPSSLLPPPLPSSNLLFLLLPSLFSHLLLPPLSSVLPYTTTAMAKPKLGPFGRARPNEPIRVRPC